MANYVPPANLAEWMRLIERRMSVQERRQIPIGNGSAPAASSGAQAGKLAIQFGGVNSFAGLIPFPTAFATVPVVVLTIYAPSSYDVLANLQGVTTTEFSFRLFQNTNANVPGGVTLHWIAMEAT